MSGVAFKEWVSGQPLSGDTTARSPSPLVPPLAPVYNIWQTTLRTQFQAPVKTVVDAINGKLATVPGGLWQPR